MGRKRADTAAFCIDHLFPKVPVRQFVLTVPMRLRFRMAASPPVTSAILTEVFNLPFSTLSLALSHYPEN